MGQVIIQSSNVWENTNKNKNLDFPTIFDAIENRNDFEKLCSNHTIKQYEKHSKNIAEDLRNGGNHFLGPPFKIRKLSKKSEIIFHNSNRGLLYK